MDLDNVFGLFGFNKDDDKNSKKQEEELLEFKNSPKFKVGMFKKMIWNGLSFRDQVLKFLKKTDGFEMLDGNVREAGDFMMYTRSYFWLQECDLEEEEWQEALGFYVDDELIVCFKLIIKYFEEIEEFEKCAYLKKIQTFVEKQNVLNLIKKA